MISHAHDDHLDIFLSKLPNHIKVVILKQKSRVHKQNFKNGVLRDNIIEVDQNMLSFISAIFDGSLSSEVLYS